MGMWWTSWGKRLAIIAGSSFGGLVLAVLFLLYTPPGHGVLAWLIGVLSGGTVAISGLGGDLPDHITAQRVVLRDRAGAWLLVEDVRLDWHVLAAIGNHIDISRIEAGKITVLRRKISGKTSESESTTVIDIKALSLPLIVIEAPVMGRRAVLTASGSLYYASRHDMAAELSVRRSASRDRYEIHAAVTKDIANGTIAVEESGSGFLGGLAGLPELGPVQLNVRAKAAGSANIVLFKLTAEGLTVSGGGTLDLKAERANLSFAADAGALKPGKTLAWSSVMARGHLRGSFLEPDIDAEMNISGLSASGTRLEVLSAEVEGSGGKIDLRATVIGLVLPGEQYGVFAAAPVQVTAHADLAAAGSPIRFALTHPLLKAEGRATTEMPTNGTIALRIPSLKALSGLTGVDMDGTAAFEAEFHRTGPTSELRTSGHIAARGESAVARLLGNAKLAAVVTSDEAGMKLLAQLEGAAVKTELHGTATGEHQSFSGEAAISDLSCLAPTLEGTLTLKGSLTGPPDNGKLTVEGTALAATTGMPRQGVTFSAEASGIPAVRAAHVRASGNFNGSPVSVKADVAAAGSGRWTVEIANASWRSVKAHGAFALSGDAPQGELTVDIARLDDLTSLTGTALAGTINAHGEIRDGTVSLRAAAQDVKAEGAVIGRAALEGSIAAVLTEPVLALNLSVPEFSASGVSGSATARLSGPLDSVALSLSSSLATKDGQSFNLAADLLAATDARHATVTRFEGKWREHTVTLTAPATLDFSNGLKFAGTFAEGKAMQLRLAGTAAASGPMHIEAGGNADLAVLASSLASTGQKLRGKIAFDATITGTPDKPSVSGTVTLTGGQIQDYTRGVNLTGIEAQAQAHGTSIRLTKFAAQAGPGTLSGSGSVDLTAPGLPVDLVFKASNARPVASDLLTAHLDSTLKLDGQLTGAMRLSGTLNVRDGNINIPEKFPAGVAKLDVRRKNQAEPPPPEPAATSVALDLTLTSPGRIFVRGRGMEAEFEGKLKIQGTTGEPLVAGALTMRRGSFNLPGAVLTFTSGKIGFNGQTQAGRLDPSLDLVAKTEANGITATLKIAGTASQPRIELSSTPQLPQDEILAQLLFQQSVKSLSAMQLAGLAQAAAALSGSGGLFDPVGAMRRSLGLDRLSVGSTQNGSKGTGSATVEAGKYVLRNVYVGAKQDLSGGTKALIEVDLTKHLKAQAQVNTGPRAANTTSTPLQDNGDSIGLSYEFEY